MLPAAYTPRPGRPAPRYTEAQARQALTLIAGKMGENRDFAWWHIPHWAPPGPRIIATALLVGLMVWIMSGLTIWHVSKLRLLVGLACGLMIGNRGGEPRRAKIVDWRAGISRKTLVRLAVGFAIWLVIIFGEVLTEGGTGKGNPLGPREIWRNDRMTGLAVGLAAVLAVGLPTGLPVGFAIGLAFVLTYSHTWPATLAWLQLRRSGQAPAVRLIPFLEDARKRDVLRTVGAMYQFRHATLQDQLASQAMSNTAVAERSLTSGFPGS